MMAITKNKCLASIKHTLFPAIAGIFLLGFSSLASSQVAPTETTAEQYQKHYALIDEYCVSCHNFIDYKPAGRPLFLDDMFLEDLERDLVSWERVVRRLSNEQMPPQGQPHPNPEELSEFRDWLVASLNTLGEQRNNPGEFILRRLNRTEYANAVRDIFGVEFEVAQYLPADGSDAGFDNVASALAISPALMDRYLSTAMQLSTMIVGDPEVETTEANFSLRLDYNQNQQVEGLPLGTRGGTVVHYNFPADGTYRLSAALFRTVDNTDRGLEGQNQPHTFQILIDGEVVHTAEIGGPEAHNWSMRNMTEAREDAASRMTTEIFVTAGPHDIGFTFIDRPDHYQDIFTPSIRSTQDIHVSSGFPSLTTASIAGPFNITGVSDNTLRDRLFICEPTAATTQACANEILGRVARLAFRGTATEADMDSIMSFFTVGEENGGFDAGIRAAIPRILTSTSFLFRTEIDPEDMSPGTTHLISELELASRLSFFLWSSVPDDELLTLAEQGVLRNPEVLEQQVRRMIVDKRSKALTTNFPDQWLALRNLNNVKPDLIAYPDWGYNLQVAVQEETRLLFDSLIRQDSSVLQLLSADYTFLNERLALHYGVEGIYGDAYRRVQLDDINRHGLLGQASILSLTSIATRTSPVLRGKWVLSNLIGTPALPPPEDLDTSLAQQPGEAPKTVRQRLEQHRADPVCNSCHRNLDPVGFALENFNAVGIWREIDSSSGGTVDAKGVLANGTPVESPFDLSQAILSRPDVFVGLVTEKLMTYALGRAIGASDMPMVRDVVQTAAENDYRFMSLILALVESPAFQLRQKPETSAETLAQANTHIEN
ncbi:DUF1592 domain-containing protein [Gammaproteobacteria bacterium AH-315-E17]|nr:DUF1592 domain-containing protein [bacterium AH-315-I11]MBN4075969.1 DUF1592 domain-containing protein [Gammaproteobacteria bacterium AH-315-E17]